MSRSAFPYLARQQSASRPGGPAPTSEMLRGSSSWMIDAKDNTKTHGFILVPAAGPYVQQGCASALYYLASGVLVVGGYKRGERGREAPKSLLEEMIEASANIVAQKSVCALVSCAKCGDEHSS